MHDDSFYHLALSRTPGIGNTNGKNLVSYCGSAELVFNQNKGSLAKIPGIGPRAISAIIDRKGFSEAEKIQSDCDRLNIRTIAYTSDQYPRQLKLVLDSPNLIYCLGVETIATRSLAVVGTRNATQYGKKTTQILVEECSRFSPVIVSGLAYGIDKEAHEAALSNGLQTVAVIAGGLDRIYPSQHKKLAEKILETGAVISEQPPGTKPDAHLFPARNRIIAGMSDATIVIEAAVKGGALITANIADSYNRLVLAIPGNLDRPYSMGCNKLIQSQKALIYTGPETIEYNLNWTTSNEINNSNNISDLKLSYEERSIAEILQKERLTIDNISWKCQIPINQTATILLQLEFKGVVKSYPGKEYGLA